MSDLRVRELERRWRASGRREDRLAWLRARGRAGGQPPSRLVLEALLGGLEARRLLGWGLDVQISAAADLLIGERAWCAWLAARGLAEVVERCALLGPCRPEVQRLLLAAQAAARSPNPRGAAAVRRGLAALPGVYEHAHTVGCSVHRGLAQLGLALPEQAEEPADWRSRAGAAAAAVALALAARAAGPERGRLAALLRACAD